MPSRFVNLGQPVNRAAPLNRGLLSWHIVLPHSNYGTYFPDIAKQNHGSLVSSPLRVPGGAHSWGALRFNGSSNYVNTSTIYAFGTGNWCISQWVKTTTTAQGIFIGMVALANSAVLRIWANTDYSIFSSVGTTAIQIRDNAGGANNGSVATTIYDGLWHHVVVQRTGSTTTQVYIDAVLPSYTAGTAGLSGALDCQYAMPIGAENFRTTIQNFVAADIGDTRIYDRSLSSDEVLALYNAGRTGYQSELNWIYRREYVKAAAGSSFQAAWARNSNQVLSLGA